MQGWHLAGTVLLIGPGVRTLRVLFFTLVAERFLFVRLRGNLTTRIYSKNGSDISP